MKKIFKYATLFCVTFTLTSCSSSSNQTNVNYLNQIEDYKTTKIDGREFLSYNIDRRFPSETVGKYDKEEYPYKGHPNTVDYSLIYEDNLSVMESQKQNLIENKQLAKYAGSYKLYNGEEIPDSTKAVDMIFSYAPTGEFNATGLYAAPGEIIDVYVPYEYKDKLFSLSVDGKGNIVYEPRNITVAIGLQVRSSGSLNFGKGVSNSNTIPIRNLQYSANEIFSFTDTVVIDNQRYFHGLIGSPVGGPIYVRSDFGTSFEMRFIGALESFYFANSITTNQDWQEQVKRVGSPYVDIVADQIRLSGPALSDVKKLTKMEEIAYFWNNASNLSNYFSSRGTVVQSYDYYVAAGAAVAFINRWYSQMPVEWFAGALNYDNLMNNGAWGDLHEFNHHHEFFGDMATSLENVGWDYYVGVEIGNNILNGMAYSLYTNIAQNRTDSSAGGGLGWWETSADPYSNLYKVYKNRFNEDKTTPVENNLNMYLAIFHSIGLEFLKQTRRDWSMGRYDPTYIYTMLTRKTGQDFYSYLTNTLNWAGKLNEDSKSYIQNDICSLTTDDSYSKPCEYIPFVSTASIYTMANQKVTSLEDFKENIAKNLSINGTWPVGLTDDEILEQQKLSTGYSNAALTYNGASGDSGILYQDKIDAAAYKFNQTGRPYKVSANTTTELNFDFNLNADNHEPLGRLISTEDIQSVELIYQQGDAISLKENNTYVFDPLKTELEVYPFAIGVKYKDSSFKDEVLYGKLIKNGSEIITEVYDTTNVTTTYTNIDDLLKNVNYSYTSIKKLYERVKVLRTTNSNQPTYDISANENYTQSLAVTTFDFIASTSGTYLFQVYGEGQTALIYSFDNKSNNVGIIETENTFNSFNNENQKTLSLDVKEGSRVSFYFYTLNTSSKPKQGSVGYMQQKIDESTEGGSPDDRTFQVMSGNSIASIGKSVFSNSKEVYPQIFRSSSSSSQFSVNGIYKSSKNQLRLVSIGNYTDVSYVPADVEDYDKNTLNTNIFNWNSLYDKSNANYINYLNSYSKLNDGISDVYDDSAAYIQNNFSNLKVQYIVFENLGNLSFNYFEIFANSRKQYLDATLGDFDVYVGDESYIPGVGFDMTKFKKIGSYEKTGEFHGMRTLKFDQTYSGKYIVIRVTSSTPCGSNNTYANRDRITFTEVTIGQTYNTNHQDKQYYSFDDANVKTKGDMTFKASGQGTNGKALYSKGDGEVSFSFSGSSLAIVGRKSPFGGDATITIDGVSTTFSTYNSSTQDRQLLFAMNFNEDTLHTVTIKNNGGNIMFLQALSIVPGSDYKYTSQMVVTIVVTALISIAITAGVIFLIQYLLKLKKTKGNQNKNKTKKIETQNTEVTTDEKKISNDSVSSETQNKDKTTTTAKKTNIKKKGATK